MSEEMLLLRPHRGAVEPELLLVEVTVFETESVTVAVPGDQKDRCQPRGKVVDLLRERKVSRRSVWSACQIVRQVGTVPTKEKEVRTLIFALASPGIRDHSGHCPFS